MKNIILSCFPAVFTLESFLVTINLKLESECEKERLKEVLSSLSSIIIAFDLDLKGQYRSYIDRRYSYEQLLYLCVLKVNESKVANFENHMLKNGKAASGVLQSATLNLSNLAEIERKLVASENLSVLYFMNKKGDGILWRQLHSIIGSSIMKYLFIYAFMFKRVEGSPNMYVQICGTRFNFIYKDLVIRKLDVDEKAILVKSIGKKKFPQQSNKPKEEVVKAKVEAKTNLNEVFQAKEREIEAQINLRKTVDFQLNQLGHQLVNKRVMLYDRNLSSKIPKKHIYSDKSLPVNDQTASKIIETFIFSKINLEMFPDVDKLNQTKNQLNQILVKFLGLHRSCPYKVFLHCYCKNQKNTKAIQKKKQQEENENSRPKKGIKRKLGKDCPAHDEQTPDLSVHIHHKSVYCFVRRCLMHVLEYQDKPGKVDQSCPLIGGQLNFKMILKHLKLVLYGLKFDSFTLNSLLHGLKQARISYLNSIECHKYKRLVLMAVTRWLFEDYIFILVRSHFFVTDTSKTNSELFFYTKYDWRRIVEEHLAKDAYKSVYNLEKIRESDLAFYCSQYQSYGMHLGRLLPKNVKNECRVISGCKLYNPFINKTQSSNFKFITLNTCLKWLISVNPELVGFACSSQKELFRRYSKFLSLNCLNRTQNSIKKWSLLKFDLNKCFDSINAKELISYIDQLFRKHLGVDFVFTLMRFSRFRLDIDSRQVRCKYEYLTVRHSQREKAFLNGISDFIGIFETSRNNRKTESQIIVPLGVHDRGVNCKKLLDSLRLCVQHVVIKIHNDLYERVNGVLQGSVCARNLCDLYLGRIESRLFYVSSSHNKQNWDPMDKRMSLNRANEVIFRIVDDYLVISSDPGKGHKIKLMLKNELSINEEKTCEWVWSPPETSITMDVDYDDDVSDLIAVHSNQLFAWCGFDFDTRTLDIYFNYEKYFDSPTSLKGRFNKTNDYRFAFVTFNIRFLRLFSMNLTTLVTDTRVNSVPAILRNFADMFAFSAVRFLVMWKSMPQQIKDNGKLQLKLILNQCHLINNFLNNKVKQVLEKYFYSVFSFLKFLCLTAYNVVFGNFKKSASIDSRLSRLINVNLEKLDFSRCIRQKAEIVYPQLIKLVQDQSVKFYKCQI